MGTKIGINGFGRIGRCVARILLAENPDVEIVGINDLTDASMLAHLLKWDSVHGQFGQDVSVDGETLVVGGKRIPVTAERDPAKLAWGDKGADIVLECTGIFRKRKQAALHLDAGAKKVIISAPGDSEVDGFYVFGVNSHLYTADQQIISNASCTTNCLAPISKVLNDSFGIEKASMLTIHSYTNDQRILDLPHADPRRARAAAVSMIPTTTGAASAIGRVLPELNGKIEGSSIRVPTPNGSLTVLTALVSKDTTADAVNDAMRAAAAGPMKGILQVEDRPLVLIDFVGNPHSSIVDSACTNVVGGNLVEVQSWYDNEWGFSSRMVDLLKHVSAVG